MYKTIDLCAGIGGIRRGFELTGRCKNVLSAEIDEYAAQTYEHLYGENPRNDLTSEAFKKKTEQVKYDILLAGFPCQAFSSAGLQLGFEDKTKGTIFFDIAEIIKRTKPKAVFLENVQNLLSHDKKRTIATILNVLEKELNYKVIGVSYGEDGELLYSSDSFRRNTRNFGLPQNRPRVYIMAFSRELYGDAVNNLPNNLPTRSEEVIFENINEILEEDVTAHYYMSAQYLQTLINHRARQRQNGNGFGYCVVNAPDRNPQIANTIMATGGSGKERNLILQPNPDYFNLQVPRKISPLNDQGIRVMTPTEWGRLQGFIGYAFLDGEGNEGFSFPDGMRDGQKYKQFGNSVSIPVIRTMAEFMLECLDGLMNDQVRAVVSVASRVESITNQDVAEILQVSTKQANYILHRAEREGMSMLISQGRNAAYRYDNNINQGD